MAKGKMMKTGRSKALFRRTANKTNVKNLASARQGMRGGFHF